MLKLSWLQIQGKCSQASLQGCWEQLAPTGECDMDAPKCRSGHKTVGCSGPTMYCTSRARLGTQHNAALTTAEAGSAHPATPQSQNSRARLRTHRSATLTTQQRSAPHTPQCHTHNSREELCTRRSATLTTQLRQQFETIPHKEVQVPIQGAVSTWY